MTMTAGSVTIADDGTPTKSGMAEAIYDSFVNNYEADTGAPLPNGAAAVPILRGFATMATRLSAIVGYITANAHATIPLGLGGLQVSTAVGDPTAANGFIDHDLNIS